MLNISGSSNMDVENAATMSSVLVVDGNYSNVIVEGSSNTVSLDDNHSNRAWEDSGNTFMEGGKTYSVYNYVDTTTIFASVAVEDANNTVNLNT